jgi:hypothetical protein
MQVLDDVCNTMHAVSEGADESFVQVSFLDLNSIETLT